MADELYNTTSIIQCLQYVYMYNQDGPNLTEKEIREHARKTAIPDGQY